MAKTVMNGHPMGISPSLLKGTEMEFSNYRTYEPGDDLRSLDWRMLARSDRYYIKQSETTHSISIKFLLDATASMNHLDSNISKLAFAKVLIACLAYMGHRQGDAIGLEILHEKKSIILASKNDPRHFQRICHELEQTIAFGAFPDLESYKNLPADSRKTLLIYLSDLYEVKSEQIEFLQDLTFRGHEIIVFHIIGQNELDFNYSNVTQLEDLETGKRIALPSKELRIEYLENLQKHLKELKSILNSRKISYQRVIPSEPFQEALTLFLTQRNRIKASNH